MLTRGHKPLIKCIETIVNYADFAGVAATSKTFTPFNLPAKAKVMGVTIKPNIAFVGPSITACTVGVGNSGSATAYAAALDCVPAVADTTLQDTTSGYLKSRTAATDDGVILTFTATGANLSVLTAGEVSVKVWHVVDQTPDPIISA